MSEVDRLARIEAELERLKQPGRGTFVVPAPIPSALGRESRRRQDAARAKRIAAMEAEAASCAERAAKNAGKIARRRRELAALEQKLEAGSVQLAAAQATLDELNVERIACANELALLEAGQI
jgi:uncharacterized protein YceH (UPF0502 family)